MLDVGDDNGGDHEAASTSYQLFFWPSPSPKILPVDVLFSTSPSCTPPPGFPLLYQAVSV
jgi:hypothetical protein